VIDIQKSFAVVDTVKTRTLIGAKAQLRTDAIASWTTTAWGSYYTKRL